MKKQKPEELLGRHCLLKCLKLYKGLDPFDYIWFLIVKVDDDFIYITNDSIRIFRCKLKDIVFI